MTMADQRVALVIASIMLASCCGTAEARLLVACLADSFRCPDGAIISPHYLAARQRGWRWSH
jgi:hypothetical protein